MIYLSSSRSSLLWRRRRRRRRRRRHHHHHHNYRGTHIHYKHDYYQRTQGADGSVCPSIPIVAVV